jgi:hypothetical protein
MSLKQVYIIGSGSKKKINIERNSIIYVANSAISRIRKDLDFKLTHVASLNILDLEIIKKEKSEYLFVRRSALHNRKPSKTIVYPPLNNKLLNRLNLKKINYKPKQFVFISKYQLWKMIFNASGFSSLIFSLKQKDNIFFNMLRLIKYILGSNINSYFIPSTGVLALLVAISKYKDSAEYYLDGIKPKKKYDNIKFYYMSKIYYVDKKKDTIPHTDHIILSCLKKKFKIKIT